MRGRMAMDKQSTFAWIFVCMGVFAGVSGAYDWGKGWVWCPHAGGCVLVPFADLLLASPLSVWTGVQLLTQKKRVRGAVLGLLTSGCYLFGSVQVVIMAVQLWVHGAGLLACTQLLVPMSGGVAFTLAFVRRANDVLEADCQANRSLSPLLGRDVVTKAAGQAPTCVCITLEFSP